MKKVWLVVGFAAAGLGIVAGLSPKPVRARTLAVVEKGSYSVTTVSGYPKNVQGKDQESEVEVCFKVTTPYLYDEGTMTKYSIYGANRATLVLSGAGDYATAGNFSPDFAANDTESYFVSGTFTRLKSGVVYTAGCFVESAFTQTGENYFYPPVQWDICASPPTVTTNGTDATGAEYFRYTGGGLPYATPALEGGGLARAIGEWATLSPYNPCLSYSLGSLDSERFVVVHSPADSPVRVEFSDGMDPSDTTFDLMGCPPRWSKRVVVKNAAGVSKASTLVHRTYQFFPTSPPDSGEYTMPGPEVALKSAVDDLTINVPMNQQ
jgi:hypothetical protein